ncbi:MAG TPA: DUF2059 domain-containing protein [Candidatus Angelobacter sp.]
MKKTIALLLIAAVFSLPTFDRPMPAKAEQPQAAGAKPLPTDAASPEQLKKLFEVIGIQKQLQSIMTSMGANIEQMMPSAGQLSEKQKAEMSKLQAELFGKMMSPEFVDRYLDMMVPIYQLHFSKSDVEQITAFYSSPAGQKFVNEQPSIVQEVFPKVMPMMQQHMQDVMQQTNYEQRMKQIFAEEEKPATPPKN